MISPHAKVFGGNPPVLVAAIHRKQSRFFTGDLILRPIFCDLAAIVDQP
jgi:hypothetical protein